MPLEHLEHASDVGGDRRPRRRATGTLLQHDPAGGDVLLQERHDFIRLMAAIETTEQPGHERIHAHRLVPAGGNVPQAGGHLGSREARGAWPCPPGRKQCFRLQDSTDILAQVQPHQFLQQPLRVLVLAAGGPAGKRLDFLMQELNREANTLGSKAAANDLSQTAVELKVLIEQMREQIQNIE